MTKIFNTRFGEVTVRDIMIDIDDTNLIEGIEIKDENDNLLEVIGYSVDNLDEIDIEILMC